MIIGIQMMVASLVGAIAWRTRGSSAEDALFSLPASGQLIRALCALAMTAPLVLISWQAAALLWPAVFLGMVTAGWGKAMDIGRTGGSRWIDALSMSGWGLVAVSPSVLVAIVPDLPWIGASLPGWWPAMSWQYLALAGLLFGPVYALFWHIGDSKDLPSIPRFATGPTEWAEVVCGALIEATLWVSLIKPP